MLKLALVCLGGAAGTALRYATAVLMAREGFSFATLTVNATGCLLIGALMELAGRAAWLDEVTRAALVSGFLGGLTTYSAFAYETAAFVRRGTWGAAAAYFIATSIAGVGLCLAGAYTIRWLSR